MEIVMDDLMSKKVGIFTNIINNKITTPEELAYKHLIKADALRMRNCFWKSIEEYLLALKYDKTNLDVYKGLGYSYKQTGYTQEAVNSFNNAKKLSPFEKILYFEVGCCYCMDKKYDKAITEYKKALKICPEYVEAQLNLSIAYELSNKFTLAMNNYLKLLESNPENISALNALGSLYIKMEMYNKAVKTFKNILKIKNDYSRAVLGIAISFDKMNSNSESLRYYKKYIKLQPNCANLPFILDRITELRNEITPRKKSHLKLVS